MLYFNTNVGATLQGAALTRRRKALVRYSLSVASNDSRSVLALKGSLHRARGHP